MGDGTYGVVLRFRCCGTWKVAAVVQHCALMPDQPVEARAVFRPGDDRCPECGCKGSTWDDPLRVPAAVTATSVADAWDMLDDRLARERREQSS